MAIRMKTSVKLSAQAKCPTHSRADITVRDFFFFFNDTATTEIYTRKIVGSVRCV